MEAPDEPVPLPIDGTLDLHVFRPREVPEVVEAYLEACREQGLRDVRIIHGKGKGVLRDTVRALLQKHPQVESYGYGGAGGGEWGATVVRLRA